MSAFKKAAAFLVGDALRSIYDPNYVPYQAPLSRYYLLECLEDHVRQIDAGVGGVSVPVKKGEIVRTRDLSIHSVDISKFRKMGVIYE